MSKVISEAELDERCKHPRVTLEQVELACQNVSYLRNTAGTVQEGLITYAQVTLPNGYVVTGQSACADPRNFNEDLGQRAALGDAKRQVWGLLAYDLRNELVQSEKPVLQRVIEERDEYQANFRKLAFFIDSEPFLKLSPRNQELLMQQQKIMNQMIGVLSDRIREMQLRG